MDSNGIHFDVYFNGTEYIAISEINEIRYTIQTKEISNIILIAAGLRKA